MKNGATFQKTQNKLYIKSLQNCITKIDVEKLHNMMNCESDLLIQ